MLDSIFQYNEELLPYALVVRIQMCDGYGQINLWVRVTTGNEQTVQLFRTVK